MRPEPSPANAFLDVHAMLLLSSYRRWTGQNLLDPSLDADTAAKALYGAPFAILSHDTSADPLFTYANLAAQRLFEMPWREIVGLPSRLSAQPLAHADRERLLAQVASRGYIEDYSGVRLSRSGRRFRIRNATVWNLITAEGELRGQAATFSAWEPLAEGSESISTPR